MEKEEFLDSRQIMSENFERLLQMKETLEHLSHRFHNEVFVAAKLRDAIVSSKHSQLAADFGRVSVLCSYTYGGHYAVTLHDRHDKSVISFATHEDLENRSGVNAFKGYLSTFEHLITEARDHMLMCDKPDLGLVHKSLMMVGNVGTECEPAVLSLPKYGRPTVKVMAP